MPKSGLAQKNLTLFSVIFWGNSQYFFHKYRFKMVNFTDYQRLIS